MRRASIPDTELRRFARLAAPLLHGAAAGGYGPRAARTRAGRGLEYLDTRPYEPGDDMRAIDWRQSARGRNLVIRRYRDETAADWFICLDCSASVGWGGRKWPTMVQLATALSYTLLYAGHRVALLLFSDHLLGLRELGRGAHHYAALIATLYSHRPAAPTVGQSTGHDKTSNLGLCRPRLTQNSNVFILSDFLEPNAMRPELKSIRARAATTNAIQVLDVDEVRIPTHSATALQDVESGEIRNVATPDDATLEAILALESHNAALRKNCSRLGVRFTSCLAKQHWQSVLLDHLQS